MTEQTHAKGLTRGRNIALAFATAFLVAAAAAFYLYGSAGASVAEHVSRVDPRGAATSFLKCLTAGHQADVLACVVGEGAQQGFARELIDAVEAGVPAEALNVLPATSADDLMGSDVTVTVDGDTAVVELPARSEAEGARQFHLARDDDVWQVDLLRTTGMSTEEAQQFTERLNNAQVPMESE